VNLLLNIDVPDLGTAETFYVAAFGLSPARRFGNDVLELAGARVPVYLLRKRGGGTGGSQAARDYARHWTPLHCDVVVDALEPALARALSAGAAQEGDIRQAAWGRIVQLSDPFGHGWCLLEFSARGYDEIADPR
jgi:lactoylglutathione lyase